MKGCTHDMSKRLVPWSTWPIQESSNISKLRSSFQMPTRTATWWLDVDASDLGLKLWAQGSGVVFWSTTRLDGLIIVKQLYFVLVLDVFGFCLWPFSFFVLEIPKSPFCNKSDDWLCRSLSDWTVQTIRPHLWFTFMAKNILGLQ